VCARTLERGGPRPRGRLVVPLWRAAGATRGVVVQCVRFLARELVRILCFLRDDVGFPRLFRGPLGLSPTSIKEKI
jgi:hypothetical protein